MNEGKKLALWLVRGVITCYLLAAFLSWGRHEHRDFKELMCETVSSKIWGELGPVTLSSLLLCLSDLREGKIDASQPSFSHLQELYAQMIGGKLIAKGFPQKLEKTPKGDPVCRKEDSAKT